MKKYCVIFSVFLTAFFYSCQQEPLSSIEETIVEKPLEPPPQLEQIWQNLNKDVLTICHPSCKKDLNAYLATHTLSLPTKKTLPLIPYWTTTLQYRPSVKDPYQPFQIRTPIDPKNAKGLLLVLGPLEQPLTELEELKQWWIVQAPSRGNLNYQLLAEKEIWTALHTSYIAFPEAKKSPVILVGTGVAADPALLIANREPWKIHAVAFSGGKLGLNLVNIKNLPVFYFSSSLEGKDPHQTSPWGREHLIDRLQAQGNTHAKVASSLEDAANQALLCKRDPFSIQHTFSHFSDAKVAPWLTIEEKKSTKEKVFVETHRKDSQLFISSKGATCIRVDTSILAKKITQINWNGTTYSLNKNKAFLLLGERPTTLSATPKSKAPSRLIDFFRNEPLYIVYQDQGAESSYLTLTKKVAYKLANLQFTGLKTKQVCLTSFPLSQYLLTPPKEKHRIIVIGQEKNLSPLLEKHPGYYPVKTKQDSVAVNYIHLPIDTRSKDLAYLLTYPPEDNPSLVLAKMLIAENTEALRALSSWYLCATNLYETADVIIFGKKQNTHTSYRIEGSFVFDGFWGCVDTPDIAVSLPSLSRQVWDQTIKEMITEKTKTSFLLLPNCTDPIVSSPTKIGPETLSRFIPEKYFAKIDLGSAGNRVVQRLTNAYQSHYPLADISALYHARKQKQPLITDARILENLQPTERKNLHYTIVPLSLHDMLEEEISIHPTAFGKKILQTKERLL